MLFVSNLTSLSRKGILPLKNKINYALNKYAKMEISAVDLALRMKVTIKLKF